MHEQASQRLLAQLFGFILYKICFQKSKTSLSFRIHLIKWSRNEYCPSVKPRWNILSFLIDWNKQHTTFLTHNILDDRFANLWQLIRWFEILFDLLNVTDSVTNWNKIYLFYRIAVLEREKVSTDHFLFRWYMSCQQHSKPKVIIGCRANFLSVELLN